MKRTIVVVALLAVAILSPTAWAKSYDHPLIDITFRLQPDGSADVTEIRAFRFDGPFTWAEIERGTRGQYGTYDIQYQGVWDADTNQPLRFTQTRSGNNVILRWEYSAEDTTKRFLIRYRILDAVQRYTDAAQFYWQAEGPDHAPIDTVRIAIIPPRASLNLFKVFIHSSAPPGDLDIAGDFSRATIEQANIPDGSFVEVRALLDPALFPSVPASTGQTHESLLEDERAQSARTLREGEGFERIFLYGIGGAGPVVGLLVGGLVLAHAR